MTLSQVQSLIDYMLNSDWEEYFSHFINCAELGRWTNQDKMLGLSANLRGPERIFYLSLSQDERADYYSLVDKLAQRFGSVRQQISGSVNLKLGNDSRGIYCCFRG